MSGQLKLGGVSSGLETKFEDVKCFSKCVLCFDWQLEMAVDDVVIIAVCVCVSSLAGKNAFTTTVAYSTSITVSAFENIISD